MQDIHEYRVVLIEERIINNMKKSFITCLFVAFSILHGTSQVKFGVEGGLNLSNMVTDEYNVSSKLGFQAGPTVQFLLPVSGFSVQSGIMYSQYNSSVDAEVAGGLNYETTVKQQQISVPINMQYSFFMGNTSEFFVYAGPQIGVNIGSKETATNYGEWVAKSVNFGVNLGLGMLVSNHIRLSADYHLACTKDGDIWINRNTNAGKQIGNSRTNAWQFSVGYIF